MKAFSRIVFFLTLACLMIMIYVYFTKDFDTGDVVLPLPSPLAVPLSSESDTRTETRTGTGAGTGTGTGAGIGIGIGTETGTVAGTGIGTGTGTGIRTRNGTNSQGALLAWSVWNQCQKQRGAGETPKTAPLRSMFKHIVVEDTHKILYCNVPKVACSNWRRVLLVLAGRAQASQMAKLNVHSGPNKAWLPSLSRHNRTGIQHRLDNYFKFTIVREPLERLLSAWRNKFQRNWTTSVNFRRGIVKHIIGKYPEVRNRLKPGYVLDKVVIRFEEFLRYVADKSGEDLDGHWERFHKQCHPCTIHYDFVGKLDSVEEDAAYVLSMVRGDHEVSFPERSVSYKHPPTDTFVDGYYGNVSASLLTQILDMYKPDFTFFNYSLSRYRKLIPSRR